MKRQLLCALLGFVVLSSCTKKLEEINENPNSPTKVEPDFLFTTAILEAMNLYGGAMDRVVFYNYTHHYSGFQGEFQRYTYSQSDNNTYWRNTYIKCLQPV